MIKFYLTSVTTLIFSLFLLLADSHQCLGQSSTDSLRPYPNYAKAPVLVSRSPQKLAAYLTENDSSEAQKALNLYTWITHNIRHEYRPGRKKPRKKQTVEKTLRKKKAYSREYSELFDRLCSHAGIPSLTVGGYYKGGRFDEEYTFHMTNMTWNAVRLNGRWHLLDLYSGSGGLVPKRQPLKNLLLRLTGKKPLTRAYKYRTSVDYGFFLRPSGLMIEDHLPAIPELQLLEYPVSMSAFNRSLPRAYTYQQDTATSVQYELPELHRQLDKYYRLSPRQYEAVVAEKALTFNDKNTILLAFSELNRVADNSKKQMSIYKGALAYGKKQLAAAKSVNKTTLKVIKKRFAEELEKPSAVSVRQVKKQLFHFDKILNSWESAAAGGSRKAQSLMMAQAQPRSLKKNMKQSRYQKPSLVEKNLAKISKTAIVSDSLLLICDSLYRDYKQRLPLIQETAEKLIDLLFQQAKEIDSSTGSLYSLNNLTANNILWRIIGQSNVVIDSMETRLFNDFSRAGNLYKEIYDLNRKIRADASLASDLIIMNCKLAGAQACDTAAFEQMNLLIDKSYQNQIDLLNTRLENVVAQLDPVNTDRDLTSARLKLLKENADMIRLYKDFYIGKWSARYKRQLYSINLSVDYARKGVEKLRKQTIRRRR